MSRAETIATILEFIRRTGRRPSYHSSEILERRLAYRMNEWLSPSKPYFDAEFRAQVEALLPMRVADPGARIREIIAFCQEHGRRPCQGPAAPPEEQQLARCCANYLDPKHNSYRPAFARALAKAKVLGIRGFRMQRTKDQFLAFCEEHGRRPWISASDIDESKLAYRARNYLNPSGVSYDPEFTAAVNRWPKGKDPVAAKQAIRDFIATHGRKPSVRATDDVERALACRMRNYVAPSGPMFDPAFREEVAKTPTRRKARCA